MKLKKTVAIAAAAGALAAISVPAMAFENEFHGLFNAKFYLSNFDNAGAGFILVPNATGLTARSDMRTQNYFEQRARLQYTAKASNDLKLVTQFELDSTFGGNGGVGYRGIVGKNNNTNDGNNAGQLDADSITLETKHVYLDFNAGSTNVKVGIQPYKDAFKGIYLDADVSAISTTTKMGGLTLGAAYARIDNQKGGITYNQFARDLFLVDTSYALSKDAKVGFSYYLDANYTAGNTGTGNNLDATIHTFGLNANAKMGPLGLSGFALMQAGHTKNPTGSIQNHGYAMNAAATMAVGPGKAKTAILFTSGDNNVNPNDKHQGAFYNPGGDNVSTYSESGMMILNRNTGDDGLTTDHGIAWSANNRDRGMLLYTLGYDAKLSPKAYLNANAGMLWTAKSTGAPLDQKTGQRNAGDLMATELNIQAGYKLYDNLTLKLQAAYAILGGYYANSATNKADDPENPYTIRTGLNYTF